ncbi:MAG: hypothetical protein EBX36_07145 [Planctomycetia bacterium]|nr:hypothetical protein [Planctomycetia bacterium]
MNRRACDPTAARIALDVNGASHGLLVACAASRKGCGNRSTTVSSMYSRTCRSSDAGSSSIGMQSTSRNRRTLRSSSCVAHSPACWAHHSVETGVGSAASARSRRPRPISCTRRSICRRSAADSRLGSRPTGAAVSSVGGMSFIASPRPSSP